MRVAGRWALGDGPTERKKKKATRKVPLPMSTRQKSGGCDVWNSRAGWMQKNGGGWILMKEGSAVGDRDREGNIETDDSPETGYRAWLQLSVGKSKG